MLLFFFFLHTKYTKSTKARIVNSRVIALRE